MLTRGIGIGLGAPGTAQSSNALLPDHTSLLDALGGYGLARRTTENTSPKARARPSRVGCIIAARSGPERKVCSIVVIPCGVVSLLPSGVLLECTGRMLDAGRWTPDA